MITELHTVHWNFMPAHSNERQRYFTNKIDGRIVSEFTNSAGSEYYECSEFQMKNGTLGIYLGCQKKNDVNYRRLVCNHDTETEFSLALNDAVYL